MARRQDKKRVLISFKLAWEGLSYVLSSQINMKIHFCFAFFALLLAFWVDLPFSQFVWVLFSIFFVLCMETINTAIERTVDLITCDYHPLAKLAKDVSAGMVLLASMFAALVGLLVFTEPVLNQFGLTFPFSPHYMVMVITFLFLGLIIVGGIRKRGDRNGSKYYH